MIEATTQPRAQGRGRLSSAVRRLDWPATLLAGLSWLTYVFLYAPIAVLVVFSFTSDTFGVRWSGFTLDWYIGSRGLINDERLLGAALNTLVVAGASTLVATVFGTLTALAMERYRFRARAAVDALLYLPIVIPEIVMALALLAFFAFSLGVLTDITGQPMRMSMTTVIIAHIAFSISFVVVVVRASLRGFDRRLEEAAQDLGANEWQTFRHVTLPLILPGIIGGALLAFTISLDDFIISFFTSGPGTSLLPIEVYGQVKRSITPKINAISTIMLAISITLVFFSQLFQHRRH